MRRHTNGSVRHLACRREAAAYPVPPASRALRAANPMTQTTVPPAVHHGPDVTLAEVPLLTAGAIRDRAGRADPRRFTMSEGADLHLLTGDPAAGPDSRETGDEPGLAQDPEETPPVSAARAPRDSRGFTWHLKAIAAAAGLLVALAVVAAAAAFLTFPRTARVVHLSQHEVTWLIPVAALAAAIVAGVAWRSAQRLFRNHPAENIATVFGAIVATGTSATGMWTFFATFVPTMSPAGRVFFFTFLEIFTIAEGLRARRNMRDFRSAGVDGVAMWFGAGASAFLSSLASTTIAEALFRLVPPLAAAWLWERTLVTERRRTRQRGPRQIQWRISPERILVLLNLAEPTGRTLGEVAAQRRITQLALAAERAASLEAAGAPARARSRADRHVRTALRRAVEHADLATDQGQQQRLVSQLTVLRSHRSLVALDPDPPWALLAGERQAREGGSAGDGHADQALIDACASRVSAELGEDLATVMSELQVLRSLVQSTGGGSTGASGGGSDDQGDRPDLDSPPPDRGLREQVEILARSLRQGDGPSVHDLLSRCNVYPDLARAAAVSTAGSKRLLVLIGIYATRQLASPAAVVKWVADQIEGPAGQIDKSVVRQVRPIIEPAWTAAGYPATLAETEA
jgi:hypothetical protein